MKPREGMQYQDFAKQYYTDNRLHGRNAIKIPNETFDGYQLLTGGSVYPVPEKYIGQQRIAQYVHLS